MVVITDYGETVEVCAGCGKIKVSLATSYGDDPDAQFDLTEEDAIELIHALRGALEVLRTERRGKA